MLLAPLLGLAAIALPVTVACGGKDEGPSLPCIPNGSICLGVSNHAGPPGLDPARYFVPAISTLPHEDVDVVLRGATPGETVQVFSTSPTYDRAPQHADDDGEIAFTLELATVGAHSFIVVSELAEEGELSAQWLFVVVVAESPQLDPGVVERAAEFLQPAP